MRRPTNRTTIALTIDLRAVMAIADVVVDTAGTAADEAIVGGRGGSTIVPGQHSSTQVSAQPEGANLGTLE